MEPEGSLPCSQQSTTCPSPVLVIQSAHSHPIHLRNILILSFYQGLWFSLRFPHQTPAYGSPLPHTCHMPSPSHPPNNKRSVPCTKTHHRTFCYILQLKCRLPCRLIYDMTLDTGNVLLFTGYQQSAAAADSTVWYEPLETAAATIQCCHRYLTVQQSTDNDCGVCRWPWQLFALRQADILGTLLCNKVQIMTAEFADDLDNCLRWGRPTY
jgi:hypothetical protein